MMAKNHRENTSEPRKNKETTGRPKQTRRPDSGGLGGLESTAKILSGWGVGGGADRSKRERKQQPSQKLPRQDRRIQAI